MQQNNDFLTLEYQLSTLEIFKKNIEDYTEILDRWKAIMTRLKIGWEQCENILENTTDAEKKPHVLKACEYAKAAFDQADKEYKLALTNLLAEERSLKIIEKLLAVKSQTEENLN